MTNSRSTPAADAVYLAALAVILLLAFTLQRVALLLANADLARDIPIAALATSFLVGARFDLLVTAYAVLPLVLLYLFPRGLAHRTPSLVWISVCGAVFLFLGVAELGYYSQFHARLDSLAVQYLKEDPKTVLSMLWNGFPLARYLLVWGALTALFVYAMRRAAVWTAARGALAPGAVSYRVRLLGFAGLLLLCGLAARGGWQPGPPLRWGNAFHSPYLFANHLALNGSFTLVHAVLNANNANRDRIWLRALDGNVALATTRNMLRQPGDVLEGSAQFPVLRTHRPQTEHRAPAMARIRNVVVIIMESFSAQFVGALGSTAGVTPEFDRLAQEGVLFDHFFSNGTHTHQGMFASLACFPNLPNHEYLMQQPEGMQGFSGLATLLARRKYQTLYLYNSSFSWDNQEGFFRNQGMTRFVGRDDFVNPKLTSSTWGVADEDMFSRAAEELDRMAGPQPFFAVLQTLSNHTPYTFPADMPFRRYTDRGALNDRLTAFRYSDWALGGFFRKARKARYYNETLFVIVGDHGFGVPRQLGEIDLLRFHVPMLLIGPGLRQTYGARRAVVASQVDIVPTAMAILGQAFQHHCWGRDVLALAPGDPGFAVVKPSGTSQIVSLILGDKLLTQSPERKAQILRYRLYPEPVVVADADPQLEMAAPEMHKLLEAYIHAALTCLLNKQAGLPGAPAAAVSRSR